MLLTAPVRSSSPLKLTLAGTLGEGSNTSSGMVMKPKLMRKEKRLKRRSHLRKRKYERTLLPKVPPISFKVPCHNCSTWWADFRP